MADEQTFPLDRSVLAEEISTGHYLIFSVGEVAEAWWPELAVVGRDFYEAEVQGKTLYPAQRGHNRVWAVQFSPETNPALTVAVRKAFENKFSQRFEAINKSYREGVIALWVIVRISIRYDGIDDPGQDSCDAKLDFRVEMSEDQVLELKRHLTEVSSLAKVVSVTRDMAHVLRGAMLHGPDGVQNGSLDTVMAQAIKDVDTLASDRIEQRELRAEYLARFIRGEVETQEDREEVDDVPF